MLGDIVTTQDLARFLGLTPERVQQLVKDEVLEPCEEKRAKGKGYLFDAEIAVQDYVRYLQSIVSQRKLKDETDKEAARRKLRAEADLKEWQAEKARLETEKLKMNLLPSKAVRYLFEDLIAIVNNEFEMLPSRAKRDCAMRPINEVADSLQQVCDEARNAISKTSFDVEKYIETEPVESDDNEEEPPEDE